MRDSQTPPYHTDPRRFRDALAFTEANTRFRALLIEKDYYCSLVLRDLAPLFQGTLVFKGGTSLSKVHSDFFRLSEDLDFSVSVSAAASAGDRRRAAEPFKALFSDLAARPGWFRVAETLAGHNQSRQYNARLAYTSVVTGQDEHLKVEVGIREEVLLPAQRLPAKTLLVDPSSGGPALAPFEVQALALQEAYAEKVRAALTRRDPAIRDFFDVDNAVQGKLLDPLNTEFIELLKRKLSATRDPVDLSGPRVEELRAQLDPQLRPVLREVDYDAFVLDRVVELLLKVAASA